MTAVLALWYIVSDTNHLVNELQHNQEGGDVNSIVLKYGGKKKILLIGRLIFTTRKRYRQTRHTSIG